MRIPPLVGAASLSLTLACGGEPKPSAPAKAAPHEAKADEAEPDETKPENKAPPEAAAKLLPGVRGGANAQERLEAAAAAIPKGPSPLASEVATPPDVAAAPADAKRTSSGLAYKVLTPGSGPSPKEGQSVEVHYSGWTPQGRLFDSSVSRHNPLALPLAKASAGWREALSSMKVGERRRLWLTEEQARQDGLTLPPGPLVYELELLTITDG